jgi:hypothetical protein
MAIYRQLRKDAVSSMLLTEQQGDTLLQLFEQAPEGGAGFLNLVSQETK